MDEINWNDVADKFVRDIARMEGKSREIYMTGMTKYLNEPNSSGLQGLVLDLAYKAQYIPPSELETKNWVNKLKEKQEWIVNAKQYEIIFRNKNKTTNV